MGQTKHHSEAAKTRGHLRLLDGAKSAPGKARLRLARRVLPAIPTPPEEYLANAQALLDMQPPPSRPHLLTIAEFAWYCQVSVRTARRWIREAKLTTEKGLRLLPGDIERVDLSVWERFIHYFAGPAIIGYHALYSHTVVSVILHTLYYTTPRHHLA